MEELQEKEKLQKKALFCCQTIMRINFTELFPRLREHIVQDLLTEDEKDRLNLPSMSPAGRVDYVIDILPKKSSGWWGRFIDSLEKSSSGTAHHELAEYLETNRTTQLDDDGYNRGNTPDVAEQMSGRAEDRALATSTVNDNRAGWTPSRTSVHS